MPLEELYAIAAAGPRQSKPLIRRLMLLQTILTRMPESARNAFKETKRYHREFWTDLCTALELADWRFDLLHDGHNDLVGDILAGFDKIIRAAEAEIPVELKATQYPRIETLAKAIREAREPEIFLIALVKPDNDDDADRFVGLLNRFAEIMTYDNSQPPPEFAQTLLKKKPLLAPLIHDLFFALSLNRCCTNVCKVCQGSHRAALALFTNRTNSPGDGSSASFKVLLSKPKTAETITKWLEADITVPKSLVGPTTAQKVRFAKFDSKSINKGTRVNICEMTKRADISRVNLNVDGRSLLYHGETQIQMAVFQQCETVRFDKGFLENDAELGFDGRICLAVVLSFSFLDFCGRPWIIGGWNTENIHLMQSGNSLILQPFLVTEIKPGKIEASVQTTVADWEAKLLDHGILLMEIFQQDCFPEALKQLRKDETTSKEKREMAKTWFNRINWDICEHWCQAVQACINGTIIERLDESMALTAEGHLQLASETGLDETFANIFYDIILAPLEADFASQWPEEDPDRAISTLKLPYITKAPNPPLHRRGIRRKIAAFTSQLLKENPDQAISTLKLPYITKAPSPPLNHQGIRRGIAAFTHWGLNLRSVSFRTEKIPVVQLSIRQARPQFRSSVPHSVVAEDKQGRFFDATDMVDQKEIQSAKKWFGYFKDIKDELPRRSKSPDERIRIGVLDTGIDLKNSYISQRLDRISCWPPNTNPQDDDGHGTHVAFLLLELTKHADLRICKVANSTSIKDVDIQRIAKAIDHFSQRGDPRGEDHVDILTLSFGFPKYDKALKPINDAIRKARDSGIIIFAAAGNEGGNAGAFWPASLHEAGDVIRISSSDGMGSPSGFNPSPEIGRWICTLGQGVPSCQVAVDTGEVVHRSGSSFATPIAAALAANILGVVDQANASQYGKDFEDLRPRLRTRLGMERVLCETCVQISHRTSHYYPTPWFFFRPGVQTQILNILHILKDISD